MNFLSGAGIASISEDGEDEFAGEVNIYWEQPTIGPRPLMLSCKLSTTANSNNIRRRYPLYGRWVFTYRRAMQTLCRHSFICKPTHPLHPTCLCQLRPIPIFRANLICNYIHRCSRSRMFILVPSPCLRLCLPPLRFIRTNRISR